MYVYDLFETYFLDKLFEEKCLQKNSILLHHLFLVSEKIAL